jgi:AraC-like DNA-binding protein
VDDNCRLIGPSELLIYDSAKPMTVHHGEQTQIGFIVDKESVPALRRQADSARFMVKTRENICVPLRNCLFFLQTSFLNHDEEISAILDATLSLLSIEVGCEYENAALNGNSTELYLNILAFIENNLTDTSLSVKKVATAVGISERYVYRLFADRGFRFGAYLKAERLKRAARDLAVKNTNITDIAFKNGFSELSTFSRAFRERFGCTPREFRGR